MSIRRFKQVQKISEDKVWLISPEDIITVHIRGKFPDWLKIGDYVQYVEHGFHDVIDEEGNIIWRRQSNDEL